MKSCMRERLKCSEYVLDMFLLSVSELSGAEASLIRYVQRKCFSKCFSRLVRGSVGTIPKSSLFYKLNRIFIDGLVRVGGRLNRAYLDFEVRHPTILPEKRYLTGIIIRDVHTRVVGHLGVEATYNLVCKRYWILNAKIAIYQVIKDCVTCKHREMHDQKVNHGKTFTFQAADKRSTVFTNRC